MPKDFKIRVENIVASATLNVIIPLEKIVSKLEGMEYEPEQFPGLVYRMTEPKVAFLLFGSGKVVCTGGRSVNDVKIAVDKLYLRLRKLKGAMTKE